MKSKSRSHSRRQFLKNSSLQISTLGLLGGGLASSKSHAFVPEPQDIGYYGICQSTSSETAASFVIVSKFLDKPHIEIVDLATNGQIQFVWTEEKIYPHLGRIFHVHVENLNPQSMYALRCYQGNVLIDEREFQTFALRKGEIATLSCSNTRITLSQEKIWNVLIQQNVDAIFFNGDAVYANSPMDTLLNQITSPQAAYTKYVESFFQLPLYQSKKLIPVFGVWDDHDYGMNNGDRHHPHRSEMQRIFRAFFPVKYAPNVEKGPGVAFAMDLLGYRVFFTDGRSFRDYSKNDNQLLGEEQKIWLEESLFESQKPAIIVLGSQLYGIGWNGDAVDVQHPDEMDWLKGLLRRHSAPAIFLTGDVHYSQVQEISEDEFGYKTFELTSSAMHSYSAMGYGRRSPVSGQLHYYGWSNFCTLKFFAKQDFFDFQISCLMTNALPAFERRLLVKSSGAF